MTAAPRPGFGRKAPPPRPPPNPYVNTGRKAWVDPHTGLKLYDPASRRARRARGVMTAGLTAVLGLCFGAGALITGIPAMVFIAGFLVVTGIGGALYAAYTVDWPQPPIVCDSCFTQGWDEDLEDARGRCPVCGGTSFTRRLKVSGRSSSRSWDSDSGDGWGGDGGDGGGDGGD